MELSFIAVARCQGSYICEVCVFLVRFMIFHYNLLFSSTLMVKPPGLALQWREELATHAPALKALFHKGWTKVNVPITNSPL